MEWQSATVGGALARTLRVLRACGAAPVRFTRRRAVTTVRVWHKLHYYGCIITNILNAMLIGFMVSSMSSNKRRTDKSTVEQVISSLGMMSSVVVLTIIGCRGCKRMQNLVLQLYQLSKITVIIPSDSTFTRQRKQTFKATVGMFVVFCIFAINIGISYRYKHAGSATIDIDEFLIMCFYIVLHVHLGIGVVVVLQIALVVRTIHSTVESFNWQLDRALRVVKGNDNKDPGILKVKEVLWRVGRCYLTLCENVRRMNSREGALMLLLLAFLYVQYIWVFYRLMLSIYKTRTSSEQDIISRQLYIGISFLVTSVYVITAAVLMNSCDHVQSQVRKMRVLVSELMYLGRDKGKVTSAAARALCDSLSLHQPTFQALSMCTLNRSLFISVTTGSFTYVVSALSLYIRKK